MAFPAVRATWERPLDHRDCRGGTRTASFNETFPIEPGKVKTIKADGGLTVTLRPRQVARCRTVGDVALAPGRNAGSVALYLPERCRCRC